MEEIKIALEKLGIKGNITIRYISIDRYEVFVNNKHFGIWDANKKTFVD